jgi:hypothetical protein
VQDERSQPDRSSQARKRMTDGIKGGDAKWRFWQRLLALLQLDLQACTCGVDQVIVFRGRGNCVRTRTTTVVAAFAAVAAVFVSLLFAQAPHEAISAAAISFGVFSLLGTAIPYALSSGASAHSTLITILSSVVLAPSWQTVVFQLTVLALGEIAARNPIKKAVFNLSQFAISVTLSVVVYRFAGGVALVKSGSIALVPLVSAFIVFSWINSSSVALIISVDSGTSFLRAWKANMMSGLAVSALSLPLVFVFAKLYVEFGVLAPAAAASFIVILRQLNSANADLQNSLQEILNLTATTLEARDPYTSGHSRRVSEYSMLIGASISLTAKEVQRLNVAAMLHDVGKIHEVFAPILAKPGKLNAEERAIMESHPIKGAELVRISSVLRSAVDPIRHHHEAWDGSGYPDGLSGPAIPLFARIIAIADTIDAMASDRPYRKGLSAQQIRSELVRMNGIQFDPTLLSKLFDAGTIDAILALACPEANNAPTAIHEKSLASVG